MQTAAVSVAMAGTCWATLVVVVVLARDPLSDTLSESANCYCNAPRPEGQGIKNCKKCRVRMEAGTSAQVIILKM